MRSFAFPQASLGALDPTSVASLIASASDITLVLDAAGVICDLAFQSEELLADLPESGSWIGQPVAATVMVDSRPKVEALLRAAADNTQTRWRHINHRGADGRTTPVLYCCAPLPGGRMVMFGRDLRVMSAMQQRLVAAQQSLERDYSRLREVEVRYRLLFQQSSEAVLILDAARQRVTEANPSARQLLGGEDLVGIDLRTKLTADTAPAVQSYLAAVGAGAHGEEIRACLADGLCEVWIRASMLRQDGEAFLLVRIVPLETVNVAPIVPDVRQQLLRAVDSAPDGFVVTDTDGEILDANAAFREMAHLVTEEQARGRPLDRWLGTGVDMDVLFANLRSRGSVRFFATALRSESGSTTDVEVSAVSIRNGGQPLFGFAVRDVGARLKPVESAPRKLPRSVEQLTELIGRVPLKDLVRDATEVIERLCIEAALELTKDNRASAAEMLGLSRQSFYVKLRRYGLGDLSSGEEG